MLQLSLVKNILQKCCCYFTNNMQHKIFKGNSNKDTSFLAGTEDCRGEEKKEKNIKMTESAKEKT